MSSSLIPEADPFVGFSARRKTPETPTPYFSLAGPRNPFNTPQPPQPEVPATPTPVRPFPAAFQFPENVPLPLSPPGDQSAALAQAISMLASTLSQSQPAQSKPPRTKVREPDPFDGSDPEKLRPFLVQCQLNFNDRPTAFLTDGAKVNYALSYLKGIALSWFEPYLLDIEHAVMPPDFLSDYPFFCRELQENFGPLDPKGNAESLLEDLRMKENQRIAKYLVNFNRLAVQTGWGSQSLRHVFYRGLPDRIKDTMSERGKPGTLLEMKQMAQTIDARYWERKTEKARETPRTSGTSQATSSSSGKPSGNKSSEKSFTPKANPTSSTTSSASSSTPSKPRPAYADKLGKDGKLTSEERTRRIKNSLCLFCGGAGHKASDCRKSGSSAAKARAVTSTPEVALVPASSEK